MDLHDISAGQHLCGIEPDQVVRVLAALSLGDAKTLIYRTATGEIRERLLSLGDTTTISVATDHRPLTFGGDAEAFKLACEAKRIDLAYLFDPMLAVHTSNVEPLPHQITAVYESMLPRQPLRFVLADDPGAGKTIMAGLYIRELVMRADGQRIAIIAPGSLVEQWRDELSDKFGLNFHLFSQADLVAAGSANPFERHRHVIVRLDQVARREELQEAMCALNWDLVVFDEAHKLSATWYGQERKTTQRYDFAARIGAHTRHLLLMTATPHNGKDDDFHLFLALLDTDRFYGKTRNGTRRVDNSDLMRRMVKEELRTFANKPLFPERRAYTVNYELSPGEAELYLMVTQYVQTQMGKAQSLPGGRKQSVGFALTTLQRRLASSPEAILRSLERRQAQLEKRLREARIDAQALKAPMPIPPDDEDDLSAVEQEELADEVLSQATAATSVADLESEVANLRLLVKTAITVRGSGADRKWEQLRSVLEEQDAVIRTPEGRRRKLIIFTEHRDTLTYLHERLVTLLGTPDEVVTIHGGTPREARLRIQAEFRSDPRVLVLIATDAAGEGVNLQSANLMVNYDLPWNPNRLEQRFGRIHRIGQTEVCHLWSLVAAETREGAVFHRLLQKLATESKALNGRVFNVLGEVFKETPLKDLLIEAIEYGDQPEVRARLNREVDEALDHTRIKELLDRHALASESINAERLYDVREEMEKAEARKLQPHFVQAFFERAFATLGGRMLRREHGRFEVTYVPGVIRERDRRISGRNRQEQEPVLERYERVTFAKAGVPPAGGASVARANLLHPGHPLVLAVTDLVLEQQRNVLREGAVLFDPADEGIEPWFLCLLSHEVRAGDEEVLSRRLHFVRVSRDGTTRFAGWAPHLDLAPLDPADRPLVQDLLSEDWLTSGIEDHALALAATQLVPAHFAEVRDRRVGMVDKTLAAVHERLTGEIQFLEDRWVKLREDASTGKDVRLPLDRVTKSIDELKGRLAARKVSLSAMRNVSSATPVVLGGALVVPAGFLAARRQGTSQEASGATFAADAAARARIEALAIQAVRTAEEARGRRVIDVSAEKCGWDLTSAPLAAEENGSLSRHIEVKGRAHGATSVTVTRNEILYALNQGDRFLLAIVLVYPDDTTEGPFYVRRPFNREPDWGVASVNYDLCELLSRATSD